MKATPPAGKYRTTVMVYDVTYTVNTMSESVPSYTELHCRRKCEIVPTSGREFVAAMAVVPELSVMLKFRSDPKTRAITPKMRVVSGNRTWNIAAAYDESTTRQEVVLWCTEVY